eukprot:CAMPEP_0173186116 /NCGR_PEP_ID=MMETSP1141-20130122/9951_1 /TAXON_ID=483371 /ORGANISM="non described non described, Strain CCMP2298" /LENGTH=179 /DNA_ID=CAMNT_0014109759 /DNA_START=105 /DNA_END=645 /DNA_ORIENTATION=+
MPAHSGVWAQVEDGCKIHAALPPCDSASIALIGQVDPAFASREVGNIPATGFVFKDYLKINAFSDPKVKGVELYVADFERPLTEKLGKDFFDDPSSSSLACAQVGPVVVAKDMSTSPEGEEVFEESRNLFFKQVRVRRVYDKETNTLVYASYSTRLDKGQDTNKGRFKSSLCAVHIKEL